MAGETVRLIGKVSVGLGDFCGDIVLIFEI